MTCADTAVPTKEVGGTGGAGFERTHSDTSEAACSGLKRPRLHSFAANSHILRAL